MNKIFIFILLSFVFSLPRYSLQESTSCMSCHINPTGGGMRNDYGNNIYSLEELPLKKWINHSDEDWGGYITDNVQIGGDFRLQVFKNGEKNRIFPMQADLYSNIDINSKADLYFKIDLSRRMADEYFIIFNNLIKNSWIKIGQSIPNYGIKIEDHTSFTRGGNDNSLFSSSYDSNYDKGLFFDVGEDPPVIVEFGTKYNGIIFTTSIGTNYISPESYDGISNFALSLNSFHSFDDLNTLTGMSYMKEFDIESYSIFGGLNVNKISLLFELDKVNNWVSYHAAGNDNVNSVYYNSYANLFQFTYKVKQGMHMILKFDYFDKDFDTEDGSLLRKTIGFEYYPLNMFEVDFYIRNNSAENLVLDSNKKNEFLMQVHTWF